MSEQNRNRKDGQLLVMLAIQRLGSDAYGNSIRDEIEKRTGRRMTVGVLYALLNRLEVDGLLRSWDGESTPQRGGRAKRYFALTGRGQKALDESLSAIDNLRAGDVVLVPAFAPLNCRSYVRTLLWAAVTFGFSGAALAFGGDGDGSQGGAGGGGADGGAGGGHRLIWVFAFSVAVLVATIALREATVRRKRSRASSWNLPAVRDNYIAEPPRCLDILFWIVLPSKTREAQIGDLTEDYGKTLMRYGKRWIAIADFIVQGLVVALSSYWQAIERLLRALFRGA